jgi:hypothetical protein
MIISNNKNWTFGIVTANVILTETGEIDATQCEFLVTSINSIIDLNIPKNNFEIIVIGNNNLQKDIVKENVKILYFDESIKKGWITKKKNIIIDNANYENVCIVHDYITFDTDWYTGFLKFDSNWDVCMCRIKNKDGRRWRDWMLWWCSTAPYRIELKDGFVLPKNRLLYSDNRFTNTDMYISGTVIIGKRNYLKENKFDENLCWGQGEDCEWSARCRPTWVYKMNINSTLRLLKQGYDDNNAAI